MPSLVNEKCILVMVLKINVPLIQNDLKTCAWVSLSFNAFSICGTSLKSVSMQQHFRQFVAKQRSPVEKFLCISEAKSVMTVQNNFPARSV